ncbi:MAG: adenylyl-sulfate kinase [Actinobacteria bacterium]|nr:adenylyl-sulfate kinase [Actinomycetota bacterium]
MATESKNVVWQSYSVDKTKRRTLNGHTSLLVWFTGLSGSGKSTIAREVEARLHERGVRTYVLDGDNIRHGLNADLGFSDDDRRENIRRIGEVAKLLVDAGVVVLSAFISPFREDREVVRRLFEPGEYVEVYVSCGLDECRQRDPKGLYEKAFAGEIAEFTGVSSPYEEPLEAELVLDTGRESVEESTDRVLARLGL